jgi:biotin carboxyl carrier protein
MTIVQENIVRNTDTESQGTLSRLQQAMGVLLAVNSEENFKAAALSFCNVMASEWQCERVSIGFNNDKNIQLESTSYTDNFFKKTGLVRLIQSAMEECADQDEQIIYPPSREDAYVCRAAESLSKKHGQTTILSIPLHKNETVQGVVTLQRPGHLSFWPDETDTLHLACQLCAPRLIDLYESHHWIASALKKKKQSLMQSLSSPQQSGAKIGAISIFLFILFMLFFKGSYKAESPFTLEATYQQVIPAPFDGYINSVHVEVGDTIEGHKTVLATLDTAELQLERAKAMAEKEGFLKQYAEAMRDNEIAQAQMAKANSDKTDAQIQLLNYHMEQAQLISPINGTVVKGDIKRRIGAPVKTGDVLFEVTPLESLRAELQVPEDQILHVRVSQKGNLATYSYPSRHIRFEVEKINPVAEVINKRNVFKVQVKLLETADWMRPGMEGVAKIHTDPKPYAWIWTRKATNWIRMKLWI